jgi:uncharacterized membrane protein
MSTRGKLYALASKYELGADAMHRLESLAGLDREPEGVAVWLPRVVAVTGAALAGFALILWIAANWEDFGRFGRFGLLEAALLVFAIGALAAPKGRVPLALVTLLLIGGLFAYFGQTYQTGADAWQLFALWAALALPLCVATRSDVLWVPFALVAMAGISLWVFAHLGQRWRAEPEDLRIHGAGWIAAILLAGALGPALRRWTGAGTWSLRVAVTQAVVMITIGAITSTLREFGALQFWAGLAVVLIGLVLFSLREMYDIYALSATALAANTLLVFALGYGLLSHSRGDAIASLFTIGLAAAGLLALTVHGILRVAKARAGDARGGS